MAIFKCPKCNKIVECGTCGTKYCPDCNTPMVLQHGIKNIIPGFCGKCNKALYLFTVNDEVHYKCLQSNIQLNIPQSNCIAL